MCALLGGNPHAFLIDPTSNRDYLPHPADVEERYKRRFRQPTAQQRRGHDVVTREVTCFVR